MIKFDVKNRYTGDVQFTAEIECDDNADMSIKLGLAIQWGYKNKKPLEGANMEGANMAGANMAGANMAGANMAGANMEGAYMAGANMEGANMAGANMAVANMAVANMAGANMARANMAGANMEHAYMAGANMEGANMARANMAVANMEGANMAGANMAGANMAGAYMAGANMAGAYMAHIPVSFGCVGNEKRTGFAVFSDKEKQIMVRLGCSYKNEDDTASAIIKKYGENSAYEKIMRAACAVVAEYEAKYEKSGEIK